MSDLINHLAALRSFLAAPDGSGQAARHYADGVLADLAAVDADLAEAVSMAMPTIPPEQVAGAIFAVLSAVPSVKKAMTHDEQSKTAAWSRALPESARIAVVAYEITHASSVHTLAAVRMTQADHASLSLMCSEIGANPTQYAEFLLASHVRWPGPPDLSPMLDRLTAQFTDMADNFAIIREKVGAGTVAATGSTTGTGAAAAAGAAGGGQVAERCREYARPTSALSPRMRIATPRGGWGPAPRPSANSPEAKAWRSQLRF